MSVRSRNAISPSLLFVLLLSVLLSGLFMVGFARSGAGTPRDNPARGLKYQGMVLGTSDLGCDNAYLIELETGPLCTHGPDPAPEGVDVRVSRDVEDTEKSFNNAFVKPASVSCTGDGQTGNRVQLVYARAADVADRYDQFAESFQQWSQGINGIISDSAAKTGGASQVRYVHDAQCVPNIMRIQLSASGDDTFSNSINEMIAAGHNRTDRKYLMWVDANVYCGIATIRYDDRVGQENSNNRGQSYGRTDNGCWGFTSSVEAHELVHGLGGVQKTSPNSDGQGHCSDRYDRLCYDAGYGVTMNYLCSNSNERLLDCNNNDYFSAYPPSENYLSTHWNTARSSFLLTEPIPSAGLRHPDGTLVKDPNSSSIYLLEDGKRRYVPSMQSLQSHTYDLSLIKTAVAGDLSLVSDSNLGFREGTLLKGSSPNLYIVDQIGPNDFTKRLITSPAVLSALGYKTEDIIPVSNDALPLSNGLALDSVYTRHPDGSLVKPANGHQIFRIENGYKRYISSMEVLKSHGSLVRSLLTANAADLGLSDGSNFAFREGILLRVVNQSAVYAVDYDNTGITKRHIMSLTTFSGLGYAARDIIEVPHINRLPSLDGINL